MLKLIKYKTTLILFKFHSYFVQPRIHVFAYSVSMLPILVETDT